MERWKRKPLLIEVVEWRGDNGPEVQALALKHGLARYVMLSKSGNFLSITSSANGRVWGVDIGDRVVVTKTNPPEIFVSREELFYKNYEPC